MLPSKSIPSTFVTKTQNATRHAESPSQKSPGDTKSRDRINLNQELLSQHRLALLLP